MNVVLSFQLIWLIYCYRPRANLPRIVHMHRGRQRAGGQISPHEKTSKMSPLSVERLSPNVRLFFSIYSDFKQKKMIAWSIEYLTASARIVDRRSIESNIFMLRQIIWYFSHLSLENTLWDLERISLRTGLVYLWMRNLLQKKKRREDCSSINLIANCLSKNNSSSCDWKGRYLSFFIQDKVI